MEELSKDLDIARAKINLEVGEISEKLNSEFQLFVQKLSYEVDHLSISISNTDNQSLTTEHFNGAQSLTAAVKAAGLAET